MNRKGSSLKDRIGDLHDLEKDVEERQQSVEDRINAIDELIEKARDDSNTVDSRTEFIIRAANLVEQNLESEEKIDEEVEKIEENTDESYREKLEGIKDIFRKKDEEESEEQKIEEKTNQQMRELFELIEIIRGRHKRHISNDRNAVLVKIKGFLQDQKVPDLKLP